MRIPSRVLLALILLYPLTALAQTYTPKAIRVDAPPSVDTAEALRIAALPSGVPLTKQQIEAALQRVIDTGHFSDVGYTVDSAALIIKLTPSASSQLQPVHFSNFIWWKPAELEALLETSVPAYHGKLPLAGTLTHQVIAALVSLLHAKGIDATVDARQSGAAADSITLSITSPAIVIGDLHLQNVLPSLQPKLTALQHRLHGEDFDIAETTKSLQDSVNDVYRNAGYLAVDTSAPTTSSPHKNMLAYAVDLTSTITPGDIYHVSGFTINAQPPVSQPELQKAANIKIGDPASPAAASLARAEMQQVYADHGFYDAKVILTPHQDNQAHALDYICNFVPGDIYHFSDIDTSALALDQQAAFTRAFTVAPGAVANAALKAAVLQALQSLNLGFQINLAMVPDSTNHTVKIVIKTAARPSTH